MKTLLDDNIKEFYKRQQQQTDSIAINAICDISNLIKEMDKHNSLDIFEVMKMSKKLLIKVIKKYK